MPTWIDDIPVWGDPDPGAVEQIRRCRESGAVAAALMADHHKGYAAPIGSVLAYDEAVSPSAVGYDIACGNKAVQLDLTLADIEGRLSEIADTIAEEIRFGTGVGNDYRADYLMDRLADHEGWDIPEVAALRELAAEQLGSCGSGNHFVDVFVDTLGKVWVGVHFGSRGFGHKITTHYLKAGGAKDGMDVEPLVLPLDSNLGQEYMAAMDLAGAYAYLGRDWVCERVAKILGAKILDEVHNHHNFAWREPHQINGEVRSLVVVRKGATPAHPGQEGFVGGSMGDESVILSGSWGLSGETPLQQAALYSTVHGAGRAMSRTKAAGKARWRGGKLIRVSEGAISRSDLENWLEASSAIWGTPPIQLRGAGMDEAPQAYKRIAAVLGDMGETVAVMRILYPVAVVMAPDRARPFSPKEAQ